MMSISTETQTLIEIYNQKIELDNQQLVQVDQIKAGYTIQTGIGTTDQVKIWGPTEIIGFYDTPIEKLDSKILELNSQIENIQSEILTIGQTANSVGCGTAGYFENTPVGFTTVIVVQDHLRYRGYSFTGSNPFVAIGGAIDSTHLGLGTETYVIQETIGVYYGPINVCNGGGCTSGECTGYATSITTLSGQITPLQEERDDLIGKVNILKTSRTQHELQNYAYNRTIEQLNESIGISSSIINFLENPENEEWL